MSSTLNNIYTFVKTDAGRSNSKRSKQKNDCTVRALSLARNIPYDEAYDILAEAGRVCGKGFHFTAWINVQPWAIRHTFPAVKGERRMNPVSFTKKFTKGTWIVKTAKHVFMVRCGVAYDDIEQRPDRCIYAAWQIQPGRGEQYQCA